MHTKFIKITTRNVQYISSCIVTFCVIMNDRPLKSDTIYIYIYIYNENKLMYNGS